MYFGFFSLFTNPLVGDNNTMVRIHAWVHYIINLIGLVVFYTLAEKTEDCDDWLRDNLQIAFGSLAALGLLSCILTEVYLKFLRPKITDQ